MDSFEAREVMESFEARDELNPEQKAVVYAGGGPLLVIAGAGSGKTRTLTYRMARLYAMGVPAERILLCTFTNKAAREMMERVQQLTGLESRQIWAGTFHHIANRLLRRHAGLLGYPTHYTILDREDSNALLDTCIAELELNEYNFPKGKVISGLFGYAVSTRRSLEEAMERRFPHLQEISEELNDLFRAYMQRKLRQGLMDFDDLLLNLQILLSEFPQIQQRYSQWFQHVLVDEYQDTNRLQADIVDLLVSEEKNVMVVGDDAQSIYSFRGAEFTNILDFPKRYPGCQVFHLTRNYRSTPEILRLGNHSIACNEKQFEKDLRAVRTSGRVPQVIKTLDDSQQAEYVSRKLAQWKRSGRNLGEVAILYRNHYHSMEVQMELTRSGIPFVLRSGLSFFEQAHVKDVLCFLRVLHNPGDEIAVRRILKMFRGIGKKSVARIWASFLEKGPTLEHLLDEELQKAVSGRARTGLKELQDLLGELNEPDLCEHPGQQIEQLYVSWYQQYLQDNFDNFETRAEALRHLASFAERQESLETFLSQMMLMTNLGAEDVAGRDEEAVVLSTIHQAKGLEWEVVLILWLSEGQFPFFPALKDPDALEEERRLFYVASTRARDELYLLSPSLFYDRYGMAREASPSRFLQELEEAPRSPQHSPEDKEDKDDSAEEDNKRPLFEQLSLFDDWRGR